MFVGLVGSIVLMLYFIHDKEWRDWWEEMTGMAIDPELFRGWRFFENFTNQKNATNMAILFLLSFIVVQVFILPLVPLQPPSASIWFGKMTWSYPWEVLISLKNFMLFTLFPLAFYRNFESFITDNFHDEPTKGFKKYLRTAGITMGFFAVLVMQKAFYNMFAMLLALIATVLMFTLPEAKTFVKSALQLPQNADFGKTAYFSNWETFLTINIAYTIMYLIALAVVVTLPGLNIINNKVQSMISTPTTEFFVNIFIVCAYFFIPMLVAKAFSKTYNDGLEKLATEKGVDTTSQSYKTVREKNKLQGYVLGYIIGTLVIRFSTLMVPIPARNAIHKVLTKIGKLGKKKRGMRPGMGPSMGKIPFRK
uniref:Uncharacterized protein n=1 Tax=viral metagenome TaxID=1070528 RepID=A0A6C0KE70_9ZZZZ